MPDFTVDRDTLVVPKGAPDGGLLELHLAEVRHLESRKQEVPAVTREKAPELMYALERGYSLVMTMLPTVVLERATAEEAAEERRAIVMLDDAPSILLQKGLTKASNPAGTADQRENVLALDGEYRKRRNVVHMLKAVESLLKGKLRGFEMAYQSVKKIYDSLDSSAGRHVHNFHVAIPEDASVGDEISDEFPIGIPRY